MKKILAILTLTFTLMFSFYSVGLIDEKVNSSKSSLSALIVISPMDLPFEH